MTLDGGPYETLKENAIAMLGTALDESMESVMESTEGPAKFKCRLKLKKTQPMAYNE